MVIRDSNKDVISFLGGYQFKKNEEYRFNKYCIFVEQDIKTIVYNSLTGAIINVFKYELDNLDIRQSSMLSDYLIQNYFLVKKDFNEDEVINEYRKWRSSYIGPNYLDSPSTFVIMTTSDCNARCPYCYEGKMKRREHMASEYEEKISNYIINNHDFTKDIEVQFFGGEPLYNVNSINNIVGRLRTGGVKFHTTLISNAYLFNDKIVKLAKEFWMLRSVQVTLDGVDDKYNKIKRYIHKDDPNPFSTVIDNVKRLLDSGIEVAIRLNCSSTNYDNLREVIEFLHTKFPEYVASHQLRAYVWEIDQEVTEGKTQDLYTNMCLLNDLLNEYHMNVSPQLEFGIKSKHCMVDSGTTVFITEKGDMGVCEHYTESKFFGNVENPANKDLQVLKDWRDYVSQDTPICSNCSLKAICYKLRECTDHHMCDEYAKKYREHRVVTDLIELVKQVETNKACECHDRKNRCNIQNGRNNKQ